MPTMTNRNPFRAAGTFNGVSYIERDADRELYKEIIKNSRYLYFLTPRQSGKSSLISHIRKKLDDTIFKSALIDLSTFPANCLQSENSFKEYFVNEISSAFNFQEELENKKDLKKVLEKILKKEDRRILIFVDEVDRLLRSDFKDSWFGLIRSFFNCRANEPDLEFDKLQFILSGAATVTSLISNKNISPFNVGKSIELYDFTYKQTVELTKHLEKGDWEVFENAAKKIYEFTSGSVYLSQLILEQLWDNALDKRTKKITEEDIEKTVNELIIESSNNVHFNTIYESIVNEPEINKMFIKAVEGHSLDNFEVEKKKRLRITGILNEKDRYRNRIYKEVFDVNGPLSLFRYDIKKKVKIWERIKPFMPYIYGIAAIIGLIIGIISLPELRESAKYQEYVSEKESDMVLIEAGGFLMGSSEEEIGQLINDHPDWRYEWFSDEIPQRKIYLDSFYISRFEITNAQYGEFLNDNPDYKRPNYWEEENFNGPDQPVVGVSWNDAAAYCNWLSKKTKKKYRLPTEAEWEKAARGTDGRIFPWGNAKPDIKKANFMQQHRKTVSVREKADGVSVFGLMHMSGNVSEWCNDWYDENYYKNSTERYNPIGPLIGNRKVVRGGSWLDNTFYLRCAARYQYSSEIKRNNIGFRIVRIPEN